MKFTQNSEGHNQSVVTIQARIINTRFKRRILKKSKIAKKSSQKASMSQNTKSGSFENLSTSNHSNFISNHKFKLNFNSDSKDCQQFSAKEQTKLKDKGFQIKKYWVNSNQDLNINDFQGSNEIKEYFTDILKHLHSEQTNYFPLKNLKSNAIKVQDRHKLVTWLFKISKAFNFCLQTAFQAINIVDRVTCRVDVQIHHLQYLGITALFIAAKVEQINLPRLSSFALFCCSEKGQDIILRMEQKILLLLDFNLCFVSPLKFIDAISYAQNLSSTTLQKAYHYAQLAYLNNQMVQYRSSYIGLGCLFLSSTSEGKFADLQLSQCIEAQQLQECIHKLKLILDRECI